MLQLPVLKLVTDAWAFVWKERVDFVALAAPFVIALAILDGLITGLSPATPATEEPELGLTVLDIIRRTIGAALTVMFSVAWYRRHLLPQHQATVRDALRWTPRHWRFAIAVIRLILILAAPWILLVIIVGPVNATTSAAFAPLVLALAAVTIYAQGRLSLLMPAAAVDDARSLKACWQLTNGNGWRISFALILVVASTVLVSLPVMGVLSLFTLGLSPGASLTLSLIWSLVGESLSFIGLAVIVSVLSIAYRDLTASSNLPAIANNE